MRAHLPSLLLLGALAGGCAHVEPAPEPAPVSRSDDEEIAKLELAFWHCDYVATTRGAHATPIAACRHATEELKQRKFNGKFSALLQWWRENKLAEHQRVEQALKAKAGTGT